MRRSSFALVVFCSLCAASACDDSDKSKPDVLVPEETEELCQDAIDNDQNGLTDCEEETCKAFAVCAPKKVAEETEALCSDDLDNDDNGLKDCQEDSCFWFTKCHDAALENTYEKCHDSQDNDRNGKADCADMNCQNGGFCTNDEEPETTEELCGDGADNDRNGKADCNDANCLRFAKCQKAETTEALCSDNLDNDNNGIKDCDETSCKDFAHCKGGTEGCTDGVGSCTGQFRNYCEGQTWKKDYCNIACVEGRCKTCEEKYGPETCVEGVHSYCAEGDQRIEAPCPFGCEGSSCAVCIVGTARCNADGKTLETCELDENGKSAWVSKTCDGACVDNACKGCLNTGTKVCSGNVLKTCNADHEYDVETCEFGCENDACRKCTEEMLSCADDGITVTKCTNNQYVSTNTRCEKQCINGACNDENGNHLKDENEPGYKSAKSCYKHSECDSGFCDTFIGKCSIKCTDTSQCIDGYVCRADGRCAAEAFVTVWKTTKSNETIEFPTAQGGTCVFTIDWGDGDTQNVTSCGPELKHRYWQEGDHTVKVYGDRAKEFRFAMADSISEDFMGAGMAAKLQKVISFGPVKFSAGAFTKATGLYELSKVDIPDASRLTSMEAMFYAASKLQSGVANWDVSNSKSMRLAFSSTVKFDECLKWDTSSLETISRAFEFAEGFVDSSHCLNNWDVSKVTDMRQIFNGAKKFNGKLDTWDTSHVITMRKLFMNATAFDQDISAWNVSNVTSMSYMFNGALSFNNGSKDLTSWNVSKVMQMSYMFSNAQHFNRSISSWNVGKVTSMAYMFSGSAFNGSLADWDVSKVEDMSYMFYRSEFGGNKDLSKWNVSKVTNMSYMFSVNSFNGDLSKWDVSNVTDMSHMFEYNKNFNNSGINNWGNKLKNVTNMERMFYGAIRFNQPLSGWNVSSVTNMKDMFGGRWEEPTIFNQDITGWDVSKVKDMSGMFVYNKSFNKKIGAWKEKTANVIDMSSMFAGATAFNQDVSTWDVGNVQNMKYMFAGATNYNTTSNDWGKNQKMANKQCSALEKMFEDTKLSCSEVRNMLKNWGLSCDVNALRGSKDCN